MACNIAMELTYLLNISQPLLHCPNKGRGFWRISKSSWCVCVCRCVVKVLKPTLTYINHLATHLVNILAWADSAVYEISFQEEKTCKSVQKAFVATLASNQKHSWQFRLFMTLPEGHRVPVVFKNIKHVQPGEPRFWKTWAKASASALPSFPAACARR